MASKIDPESMKNQGCVADAFLERFWAVLGRFLGGQPQKFGSHFRQKNRKKCIQKDIQKSMPKKYRKLMPNGSQNEAKMDAKIMIFSVLLERVIFRK